MTKIEKAMKTLKQAFIDDPDYAHSWHCNIAMACYDEVVAEGMKNGTFDHADAHAIGNRAASRFMKLAFDVETKA